MMNCDFNSGNGLIDPKSMSENIKMISIADDIIKICNKKKKNTFHDPPLTPHMEIVFLAGTPSFFNRFH